MPEVAIGCKLPHGVVLELIKPGELRRPNPAGTRVILKGANSLRENKRLSQAVFPYAITMVDKSFWDSWFVLNQNLEFVRKGFVFVAPNSKDAQAIGRERLGERTGLEPLAQERDPRLPKGPKPETPLETDSEQLARLRSQAA